MIIIITELLFPPHLPLTRRVPPRATKLHSTDKLTNVHPTREGKPKVYKLLEKLKVCRVFANPKNLLHDLISKLTDMSSEGGD